jgi:hypothetical protein
MSKIRVLLYLSPDVLAIGQGFVLDFLMIPAAILLPVSNALPLEAPSNSSISCFGTKISGMFLFMNFAIPALTRNTIPVQTRPGEDQQAVWRDQSV